MEILEDYVKKVIAFTKDEEMLKEIPASKKASFIVFPVDT